jgi:hypothetical protein
MVADKAWLTNAAAWSTVVRPWGKQPHHPTCDYIHVVMMGITADSISSAHAESAVYC